MVRESLRRRGSSSRNPYQIEIVCVVGVTANQKRESAIVILKPREDSLLAYLARYIYLVHL